MKNSKKKKDKLELFGENLAALRKEAGLTQEKLAEKIDVDARTVQKFEAGEANITLLNIYALADALKVKPGDLI